MKTKAILAAEFPTVGAQNIDAASIQNLVTSVAREEAATFTIASNVLNFDELDNDAYPDDIQVNSASNQNITSFTNLGKATKFGTITNKGTGSLTITKGNNIRVVGGAATAVLAQNDYVTFRNFGTYIFIEAIVKQA